MPARPALLLAVVLSLVAAACGGQESARDAAQAAGGPAPAEPTPSAASEVETVSTRGRNERPLPGFSGTTFEGRTISAGELLGRRLVLFFFDASRAESAPALEAVAAVAPLRGKHNFRILGIASGASTPQASAAIARHGYDFPVVNDASGSLARRFGMDAAAALLFVDAEGYMVGAMGAVLEEAEDPTAALEARIRDELRLPPARPPLLEPGLGVYPAAPDFEGVTLDGETVRLDALRGRPTVLVFFLHTCPHCHDAMAFLRDHLATLPAEARPHVLGIPVAGSPAAIRAELRSRNLDFLPVVNDADGSIRARYAVVGGVPDILLLDGEGRIRARSQGWMPDRDPALLRMRLARAGGRPVPMLLHATGYSGNDFCGVCHETQAETWRFTAHARAYDTLVAHTAERDAECVGCHVVGWGEPGGFSLDAPRPWLEDVGCETCHGRGGPHLSPQHVGAEGYAGTCGACHDPKHSLGFDYATFAPRVSHAANAHLLALPLDEKREKLAELGSRRKPLFPDAAYVGSDACQGCHAAEYATWAAQPHARAVESLEAKGEAGSATCQACHTTAAGEAGGFPLGGVPAEHPDLARVGCESCHGPGGDHVAEGARRAGTIVSLGDKCDSCVILQICGRCHDDANDPGFEFQVQEKIDAQRHGTIEPSAASPGAEARRELDSVAGRLATLEPLLAAAGGR